MALAAASGMPYMVNYVTVMKRTSTGYPCGSAASPEALSTNTVYNAYLIKSINRLTPAIVAPPRVRQIAGGTVRKSIPLPRTDFGTPQFVLEEDDETFMATFVRNSAVDITTDTTWAIRDDNPGQTVFPQCIVGFHIRREAGTASSFVQYWDNYFYLNCSIQQSAQSDIGTITGNVDNPSELTFDLILSLSDRYVHGELISAAATSNATGYAAVEYVRSTTGPLMTTLYNADGIATTFITGYRPLASEITGKGGNHHTLNGTSAGITSFSTTTATVTLTAAGSSADKHVMVFDTNFIVP